MNTTPDAKPIPVFQSDADAERFVDREDLSSFDLSGFVRTSFEFQPKQAQLNMRIPAPLLEAVKAKAKARGVPYTRYIRMLMEADVTTR